MNYFIFIKKSGSVRGVEKGHGIKGNDGDAKVGNHPSTKDLKYIQVGNDNDDDEEEKSGKLRKVSNLRCWI
jgi:hypothetical protein